MDRRKKEVRLFINQNRRWISVPFTHPATFDTLLHGPSGTGKSTFIAAMANFLSYDVYDINLSKVSDSWDLKLLLSQTTNKSLIVIEDLDSYLCNKSLILNFMDGCYGEERIMIFTMNSKDEIDPIFLRPGRIDVQIHFPLCDFHAFKSLASSHLSLKDHKLFPQVEENFQSGAVLSQAEISEIMISNRSSPSRALKMVISAQKSNSNNGAAQWLSKSDSVRPMDDSGILPNGLSKSNYSVRAVDIFPNGLSKSNSVRLPLGLRKSKSVRPGEEMGMFGKETTVNELRNFYGLLRVKSKKKETFDLDTL